MTAAFRLSQPARQFRLTLTDAPPAPKSLTERYRPATLAAMVGQGSVVYRLETYLESPYSTAFLFEGPTGTGKTTAALALAAELGAVEFGGLEIVKSGCQDADAVEYVLNGLRYTPMLGSGWKVIIVDEADWMTPKASQVWLSALEDLPGRSVVIFTTNNPAKFPDRFLDRCQRFPFVADPVVNGQDAQTLIASIWEAETGDRAGMPALADLPNVVDKDGNLSYRRVVRALEPLLASVKKIAPRRRPHHAPRKPPSPPGASARSWPSLRPRPICRNPPRKPTCTTSCRASLDKRTLFARMRGGKEHAMPATAATEEIRQCRQALGLTLEAFAARVGVSLRAVQYWEAGTRQPPGPALTLIRQWMHRKHGEHMKALSIRQPWAWAIVHGGKTIENRSRPCHYRGPLVIHAGKSRSDLTELDNLPVAPPASDLNFGAIIGVVDVVDCVPFEQVSDNEWADGPWCLILANPRAIEPVPFKGMLSLFNVPADLVKPLDPTPQGVAS